MIVLGIDPGVALTGYAIIKGIKNHLQVLDYGTIKTSPDDSFASRLKKISNAIEKIIQKYRPDLGIIEKVFFCKNAKTAMNIGRASGAIMLTCAQNDLQIKEFTPLEIKQAIVGYGRATKKQVQKMLPVLLDLKDPPREDNAADALAAALTYLHTIRAYHA